jgi:hypothetical protein
VKITQNKFIIQAKDKTLSLKGFVSNLNLEKNQIRLFKTPSHARTFMSERYKSKNYEVKKVTVQIEVVE